MDVNGIDLDMGYDSLYGPNSPTASLAVQQWIDESHDPVNEFRQAIPYALLPDATHPDTELIPLPPAEQGAQQNQTPPATPRFDPTALLNPKSASKRPASSTTEGSDRSQAESASVGQVSLVERLHNIQERAASPAKRVKTADEQQRKKTPSNGAHFGGSSALDLNKTGGAPVPPPTQVDLTMSMQPTFFTPTTVLTIPRR
jgi:hypothetical protein